MKSPLLIILFSLFVFNANSINLQSLQEDKLSTVFPRSIQELVEYTTSGSFDKAEEAFEAIKYQLKEKGADLDTLTPIYGAELNESISHIYFLNSLICRNTQRESEYKSMLSKSLDFYPQHVPALVLRAEEYINNKRYKEALVDINKALKLEPLNNRAHSVRGKIEVGYGRFQEAVFHFSKSIAINPADVSTRINRAGAYLVLEQYEKSLLDIFECASSELYTPLINIMLTDCYHISPHLFDQTFKNKIEKYKDGESEKSISLLYLHLQTLIKAGNPKGALEDIEQLIAFGINDTPDIYLLRGFVYDDMGRFEKVQENMKLALELNPYSSEAYIKLGQVKFLTE